MKQAKPDTLLNINKKYRRGQTIVFMTNAKPSKKCKDCKGKCND